jgi:CHASE3 domain sensor protein
VKPSRLSIRQLVILGLSMPILLTGIVGWLQWESARNFRCAQDWVDHSYIVQLNLEAFLSSLKDAETGQRGYLLTHRASYREPYQSALMLAPEQLQILQGLVAQNDESQQQKDLAALGPLMEDKLKELGQTIVLEQNGDHAGALQIVLTDAGKETMDHIREIVGRMQENETILLNQRKEAYRQQAVINSWISNALVLLGLLFVVAIFFLLRRLENLQTMVTICAWSKMIAHEGQWLSIEEYLAQGLHMRVTHGISKVEAARMLKLLEEEKAGSSKAA